MRPRIHSLRRMAASAQAAWRQWQLGQLAPRCGDRSFKLWEQDGSTHISEGISGISILAEWNQRKGTSAPECVGQLGR